MTNTRTRQFADTRPPGTSWKEWGHYASNEPATFAAITRDRCRQHDGNPGPRARWKDRCRHCNEPIRKGSRVTWRTAQIMHADCANRLRLAELDTRNRDAANARRRRTNRKATR